MTKEPRPEISALIPCLNEAENVLAIHEAVVAELEKAGATYEMIFIDNGSWDGTIDLIKGLCERDRRIRLIVNSRNFGPMRSPTYGIYQTTGRCVLGISSDFQDPPALIGEMIARWRAGARIVLGVSEAAAMSPTMRFFRALGYGFFACFGDYRIIPGATGFGVYDRAVVDCLSRWRDPEPFFRGMLVESGFSLETIPYQRPPRARGQSKNSVWKMLAFGLSGMGSYSRNLLRAPLYISILVFIAAVMTMVGCAIAAITGGRWKECFLFSLVELGFAVLCLFLGLIGEQVRLISLMVRNAPLVIERERINFPPT